jgi:hypothetical protein
MLELQDFILSNPANWREKLSSPPYCLKINEKDGFVILTYNMIDSNFSLKIVQEARGIIFDSTDNFKVVCFPFTKFFGVHDPLAAKIDWASAEIQEKLDGSLLKVWYARGEWHDSTTGMIDAREAEASKDFNKTFYDLFAEAKEKASLDFDTLNRDYTYMFELTSPYNRCVVPYNETEITHIGTRDNISFKEYDLDIGVKKPKKYSFKSLDDCIENAKVLPFDEEGYVVVDKFWSRIKIKSVSYLSAHHLKNNGVVTYSRVLDMIRAEQHDDFLSIFPEYREHFDKVLSKYVELLNECRKDIEHASTNPFPTRKEFAVWATRHKYPALLFSWLDGRVKKVEDYLKEMPSEKLLKVMGFDA